MEPSPSPQPQPVPSRPDPEFALDPFPRPALPPAAVLAEHQRLVVNPFLAVAGLLGLVGLTMILVRSWSQPLALLPVVLVAGVPALVQVHCLDCGLTESYRRGRGHACSRVLTRAHRNRGGWLRWPSAGLQMVVWWYLLGGGALLIAIVGAGAVLVLFTGR